MNNTDILSDCVIFTMRTMSLFIHERDDIKIETQSMVGLALFCSYDGYPFNLGDDV